MGWALRSRRLAVGRPARVADADRAGQRLAAEPRLEVDQLALGAPALDVAVDQGGDAGRIVAAIFQALQRLDQQGGDGSLADDSDDAAHGRVVREESYLFLARLAAAARAFSFARSGAARPFFVTWRARPKATAPAGTSSVTTLPAVTLAPRPILHRRHQRAVGADEGLGADHGPPLAVAVVVHGDGAGADVAGRADVGIAEIGQVVGLGAAAHAGGLELDEVADMDLVGDVRARPDAGERADDDVAADAGALDVAEGLDLAFPTPRLRRGRSARWGRS